MDGKGGRKTRGERMRKEEGRVGRKYKRKGEGEVEERGEGRGEKKKEKEMKITLRE